MSVLEAMSPPEGFLEELEGQGMHPGWKKREPQMWPTPKRTYVAAVWRASVARKALDDATAFVSPEFAERRNLILANPIAGNSYPTCATMVAAYQLVLSGETARSHRHTPNALRMVLDADAGMQTLVNGVAVDMAPGDVVLTPQWHWHGHANRSDRPAFWIDVLDVPFVQRIENIFFEHHPDTLEIATSAAPESPLRMHGSRAIAKARKGGDEIFANDFLPTMQLTLKGLAGRDRVKVDGAIDNRIFAVSEGVVTLATDNLGTVTLARGDVAVVPSWTAFELGAAGTGGVVLEVSDRPIFSSLGFRDPSTIIF